MASNMSSLRTRSMTRALADTVADRRVGRARRVPRAGTAAASCSRTWWCWASSSASRCCFASRRRCSSCSSGVSLGMAVKPGVEWLRRRGMPALGRRAGDLRRARLPVRRRAHARRPDRRRADGDAGRARAPPLRAAADRAARVGEPHPAANRLVPAVRRRTQRRRPRSTSSPSSTPAAPWGGTCSPSWPCCCSVSTGRWRASAGCARWCCSRPSIAAGRSAASSPRSSAPSAPTCAGSRWSA